MELPSHLRTQQNMMVISQKIQDEMNKIHKAELFPAGEIDDWWLNIAIDALRHASPMSLGLSPDEMVSLITTTGQDLTMYQIAILCNNLESKTPDQLGVDLKATYPELIVRAGKMSARWNEKNNVIRATVEKRVMDEFAEIQKVAELHSRGGNGMKIAEA